MLGNGKQRKSYLHVQDCIDSMLLAISKAEDRVNIFNLGTDEYCEVVSSINWICEELCAKPNLEFSGGDRGWIGDNPFIYLDTKKIRGLGWKPKFAIEESVRNTLRWLRANDRVYALRD